MSIFRNERSKKSSVPAPVFVLALSIFVLGTSEFVIAGLLPDLAAGLDVSVPRAGLLISAFAIAMVIGAPTMAVATLRLPRKTTLLVMLVLFIAGNLVAATASSYGTLLFARVVTALATGGFWAVAAVITVRLAASSVRARALAILVGGLTVANVVGVPLGTLIGQQLGWRSAFWSIALLAAVTVPAVVAAVPGRVDQQSDGPVRLGPELAAFRSGRLWLTLGTIAVFQAGVIGTFSYLAPLLTDVSGVSKQLVPLVLAAFGIGNVIGVQLGGRFADAHPWRTMYAGFAAIIVILVGISQGAASATVTVTLVLGLGVAGFTLAAPLNARVFAFAGSAPTLASSTTTSAFNVGNTIGPWLGGIAIAGGLGYVAPAWIGAVLVGGAFGLALLSLALDRRAARRPAAGDLTLSAVGSRSA